MTFSWSEAPAPPIFGDMPAPTRGIGTGCGGTTGRGGTTEAFIGDAPAKNIKSNKQTNPKTSIS